MKINEITEGYTNENWATSAMDAARGAIGRQAKDAWNTGLAKMGSGKAAGKQQMQRVVGGVVKNFNRYLGQSGAKATRATLKDYLTKLGFQNPQMNENFPPGYDPMKQGGQKGAPTKELSRNELFAIIGKNIQQALQNGTLPKELKKFLGQ